MQDAQKLMCVAAAWVSLAGCGTQPADSLLSTEPSSPSIVSDQLIAIATPGADAGAVTALIQANGGTVKEEFKALSASLIAVSSVNREEVKNVLGNSPLFESVDDNYVYESQGSPNDPLAASQYHLQTIEAPGAWAITTGQQQIVMAVLDTGIDSTHPDLQGRLISGVNVYDHGTDTRDIQGHGTSVAGLIGAASNNERGIASVAWACPILPVRVTDPRGRATSWSLAGGIRAAAERGARVINISFGPLHTDRIVLGQARLAWLGGSLVVVSAGNSGREATGESPGSMLFVGATERTDHLAPFSTRGAFVDLVAPGVELQTTAAGGTYAPVSGTSFSAPLVSGVAALVWSLRPGLLPHTVRDILLQSADDLGTPGRDSSYGVGRLNARAALEMARDIVDARDAIPPEVTIAMPAPGAVLASPSSIEISSSDNSGPPIVTLWLDGQVLGDDAIPPYRFTVDPATGSAGIHQLMAEAADSSGNVKRHTISVSFAGQTDSTPPMISLMSPTEGATVRGVITILASAEDDGEFHQAEILVDDTVVDTIPLLPDATARVAYNWNAGAPAVSAGAHRLGVRMYDRAGNRAQAVVNIRVQK